MAKKTKKTDPGPGHNIEGLDEDQRFALTVHHAAIIDKAEEKKKAEDANLKNKWRVAKADGVQDDVKEFRRLQKDGIDPIKAMIERAVRIAKAMGHDLSGQADLFAQPRDGQAYALGKIAGMRGEPCKPPPEYAENTANGQDWMQGHGDGATLMAAVTESRATTEIITPETEEPEADDFDEAMEEETA